MADGLLAMSDMAVVSLLLQMSRALAKVSWHSWRSFFLAELSQIPRTTRWRSSDSCSQVQKLQVCASVRRAVIYCPSLWALLLKTNRLYVSFVLPMKHFSNFASAVSSLCLSLPVSNCIPSYTSPASLLITERNSAVLKDSSSLSSLAMIA